MKFIAACLALFQCVALTGPAMAQSHGGARVVSVERWVEEWDPATEEWVRVADEVPAQQVGIGTAEIAPLSSQTAHVGNTTVVTQTYEVHEAARYARPQATRAAAPMLAQYGPFVVTSPTRVEMIDSTDGASPAQFDAMMRDFPHLAVLEMVEAPGTSHDIANLAVGRRIRAAGLSTHVPAGGSVRSGAVELFLAGVTRTVDDGAQFAVHSWLDTYGRQANDFAANHPAHRLYLDYYNEMGMDEKQAHDFYAMTNSVPHHSALWLAASDMRPWLRPARTFDRQPTHLPTHLFAVRDAKSLPKQIRPEIEIKSLVTQPLLPVLALDFERFQAHPVAPVLEYRDLSRISLAQIDVSRLDSYPTFP